MIIIPMAGASSRFTKAGFTVPKWRLPLGSRPLLDWSILSFESVFQTEGFVFIYLDNGGAGDFLRERVEALGIRSAAYVGLPEVTRGQAETVEVGLERAGVGAAEPITIFNIDTIRPGFSVERSSDTDGWLECFIGEGDHWSFVKPDPERTGRAIQVTEKIRVSEYCSTGMYYFKSAALFHDYYVRELAKPQSKELFVAPLYQRMIEDGLRVDFGVVRPEEIFFSGTPDEYATALSMTDAVERSFS